MNESKRNFIKTLPLVALSGIAVKAGEHNAQAIEIKPTKRYIMKIEAEMTQAELDRIKEGLIKHGFEDVLVIAGPVELYELEQGR